VYRKGRAALGLDELRSLGGSTARHCGDQYSIVFHYYSLRGNTAMLRGLHARLCHAFLVSFRNDQYVSAVGCTNMIPPENAWLRRSNNDIIIGCYSSQQTWQLNCDGREWKGLVGTCPEMCKVYKFALYFLSNDPLSKQQFRC